MNPRNITPFLQLVALLAAFTAAALFQAAFSHGVIPGKNIASLMGSAPHFLRLTDIPEPTISAESVLVSRLRTGEVLFSKEPARVHAIGSLAKLLTALTAEELFDPLEEILLAPESKNIEEVGEKMSMVPAGELFKAEDLIKLLLIDSANDVGRSFASAITIKKEPSRAAAAWEERMQEAARILTVRAHELGMASSSFGNATGIDNPAGYSNARDLTLLAKAIYERHPELWAVTRTIETDVFSKSGTSYHIVNTNPLLKEYPMIYGSKTGTTDAAGEALLLLYQVQIQDPVSIVILRSTDRERDARNIIDFIETGFLLK